MKIRKHPSLILAAAILATTLGTLNTPAADRPGLHRSGMLPASLEHAKQTLGLTDEQIAQIKTILASEKDNLTALLSQLREAHTALRNAIHAADADEASVRAASTKVGAAVTDLALERLKLYRQISPILTPEQRDKVQSFLEHVDDVVGRLLGHASERLEQ